MARIRIDWKRIRQLPAEDVLVLLDRQAAGVLLSIMHIFEWEALFRVDDYDFADWDYLQEILSSAEEAIGNPLRLTDLITQLQLMTNAIESLYCCDAGTNIDITDGNQFTEQIEEMETNGVPQGIVDAGYAATTDDWVGYLDYKCMVSNVAFDELKRKLGDMEDLVQTGGIGVAVVAAIATILGTLTGAGVIVLIAGVATSLGVITALYDELLGAGLGFFENIAGALETQRSDYIKALYCGDGPEGSYTDFLVEVDANLDAVSATVVRLMSTNIDLKILYGGRYDQTSVAQKLADGGYDVENYSCSCLAPGEFDITYRFDSDAQNWVPAGSGPGAWDGTEGYPAVGCLRATNNNQTTGIWSLSGTQLLTDLGAPGGITEITLDTSYWDTRTDIDDSHELRIFHAGVLIDTFGYFGEGTAWIVQKEEWSTQVLTNLPTDIFRYEHYGTAAPQRNAWFDRIRLVGSYA